MSHEPNKSVDEVQRFLLAERAWLVRRTREFLHRYGLPDMAEDIVQELSFKFWKLSNGQSSQRLTHKPYLFVAIRNSVRDFFKKYRPDNNRPLSGCIKASTSPDAMEAGRLVQQLLQQLSQEEVELLELDFEGASSSEIAERFGISPMAARQRISRLMKKLRRLIQEGGDRK